MFCSLCILKSIRYKLLIVNVKKKETKATLYLTGAMELNSGQKHMVEIM
jgi:hypothetical protein